MEEPLDLNELQAFMGLVKYLEKFIPNPHRKPTEAYTSSNKRQSKSRARMHGIIRSDKNRQNRCHG